MKVPKKHRKNHSKNRFREPLWAPKTFPTPPKSKKNQFKIEVEKKCKKNEKNIEKKKPVLASEREARSSLRKIGTR